MKFVEEVVVDRVLPTLRAMLAAELEDRGLTQTAIAELLGVSQSAVSKYAAGDVAIEDRIRDDPEVQATVERVVDDLASATGDPVEALLECEALIRRLAAGGPVAAMHAEAMPALRERGIDAIHDVDGGLLDRERARSSVRRGLRILERAGIAPILPAVGSNLVECVADADGIEDVVGVPGRLFAVKGRVEAPADPEFGASEHVARVLLAARSAGSEARAAMNVGSDPRMVDALGALDVTVVVCDPPDDDRGLTPVVRDAIRDTPDAGAVYHEGAHGVEPVCYLLAADAPAAASLSADLAEHR